MICKSCGAIIEENSKFCMECGAAVPQVKKCIQCGIELPLNVKFCPECGANQAGAVAGASNGISIGNSNAIRGDVVGKKDETNISGNATIIKNEDETKKTAKCHVCGRIVLRLEGYDCPVCGEFTCKDCYVPEIGKCTSCRDSSGNEKEEVYKQAVERTLADGKIDMSERKELMSLQAQLGISSSRALELENIVKNNLSSGKGINDENALGTFDKLSFENAQKLLYDEGKANDALNLIEPLYKKYSLNEEVLGIYLNSLVKVDSAKALNVIKTLQADVLCAKLAEIDMASENKNYSLVEEKLNQAEKLWADSVLLKCRKIEFYKNLSEVSGDTSYIMLAKELLSSCGTGTTKLEKSYIVRSERMIKKLLEEELPELTDELCESLQVYKNVVGGTGINFKKLIRMPEAVLLKLEAKTHDPKVQYALWYFYDLIGSGENEFIWAEKSASQGDIDGEAALGGCYLYGRGCERNQDKGMVILNESAAKGSLTAYYFIGLNMYNQGNYTGALEWLQKAADNGFSFAQVQLGTIYARGINVDGHPSQDYTKAFEWFSKASEQGNPRAQCNLGKMYEEGKGVSQDYAKAFEWYSKASEQGNPRAHISLGDMYEKGLGVPQNSAKANELYIKAKEHYEKNAFQGDAVAQFNLGKMYEDGKGVIQDYTKAEEWYTKSSVQGNELALHFLLRLVSENKGIPSRPEGQYLLGCRFEDGNAVPQDYEKALEFYRQAANNGHVLAQTTLGKIYLEGRCGLNQNYAKAVKWFGKAAEQGDAESQLELGKLYQEGKGGLHRDYAKAIELYTKAGLQGNAEAERQLEKISRENNTVVNGNPEENYELGLKYQNGKQVKTDFKKAAEFYKIAAEQGHAEAQRRLGHMYEIGQGVPKDFIVAETWYKKASAQGNSLANKPLAEMVCKNIKNYKFRDDARFKYYEMAAKNGDAEAQYIIGYIYVKFKDHYFGDNSRTLAYKWLKEAEKQGHQEAKLLIKELLQK